MIPPILSFLSGFVALSYELLWYRAFSYASGGTADAFGLMLGAYLAGLALGSWAAGRACATSDPTRRHALLRTLGWLTLAGNVAGFLLVPAVAWLITKGHSWRALTSLVGVASLGLGTVFPFVTHLWIDPAGRVGRGVSLLYLFNILGSTAGSLLTGFVFMDHASFGTIAVGIGALGAATAGIVFAAAPAGGRSRAAGLAAAAAAILLLPAAGDRLFDRTYERLHFKTAFTKDSRFAHVVETKSGVITVTPEGRIFGGGIYDGAFNTSLRDELNVIIRAYALAELHPAPKDVLMIGLSSGSWATVVANHPGVERLTIVEINPGYLQLLPKYPAVAGLLSNPKVRIEIDDGRRWLVRNRDRRFDAIVSNTTFHWRSNGTNLLSREYLELIRSRLKPGGVYYFNTTGSRRVQVTAANAFPHALRIMAFLALSESPIRMNLDRLREALWTYPWEGRTALDRSNPADVALMDKLIASLAAQREPRESILAQTPAPAEITDDNMGTEWTERP
jgi:spermidine synthase